MRDIPDSIAAAWREGLFVGDRKPIARATVQHPYMHLRNYTLMSTFTQKKIQGDIKDVDYTYVIDPSKGHKVHQSYADFLFTGEYSQARAVHRFLRAFYQKAGAPKISAIYQDMLEAGAGASKSLIQRWLSGDTTPSLLYATDLLRVLGANNADIAMFTAVYNETYGLDIPLELPNIKSVQWTRDVDNDVADCTIECWNTKPLEIGETPREGELDLPGYYTYDRGATSFSQSRWGHTQNPWFGMLMPDNIIRTYEGYGYDPDAIPELDENLVQTGVWLIDSVSTNESGVMSIKCRDVGRILMDQMYMQPVVPDDFYDEDWSNWDGDFPGDTTKGSVTKTSSGRVQLKLKPEDSSNTPWVASGVIQGHKLSYAFDNDPNSYWLSVGNIAPSKRYAYEWVQATVPNQDVTLVRFRTKKKGYTAYISVETGGAWQGRSSINYHRDGIGQNGGDVAYVKSVNVDTEGWIEVDLGKTYKKATRIRITLGNLQNFQFGPYKYRGGIRDVQVYGNATKTGTSTKTTTGPTKHYTKGPAGSNPCRYDDYTDLIKIFCAWGGFFWPLAGRLRLSDGTYRPCHPIKPDSGVLGAGVRGRVWGDFQETGTNGPAALDHSNFDKKSLMDCIVYIRDILGFIFNIDETGAVQWRLPNLHDYGNWMAAFNEDAGYKKGVVHTVDENSTLMSITNTIDSKNVREAIFVGDVYGKVGSFAPGFNPNPTGLRRMAGWTDQNFTTTKECSVMADMISLRQLFSYRTDQIQIPANPAIQVDDQVRIYERNTAEGYIHYVKSISSNLDMESGQWTYDMQTYWLGYDNPDSKWLFHADQLDPNTKAYLENLEKNKAAVMASYRSAIPETEV